MGTEKFNAFLQKNITVEGFCLIYLSESVYVYPLCSVIRVMWCLYRMFQEEMIIFCKMIIQVQVINSKQVIAYTYYYLTMTSWYSDLETIFFF